MLDSSLFLHIGVGLVRHIPDSNANFPVQYLHLAIGNRHLGFIMINLLNMLDSIAHCKTQHQQSKYNYQLIHCSLYLPIEL
jgi:hypothetical protein